MNKEPLLELIKFTVGLGINDNDLPEMTFSIRIDEEVIKSFYELLGIKRYWQYSKENMEKLLKSGYI